ncbi:hypothetical protein [Hoeflea alexandrii]|uniref:hypothetical protein n=1 Tax=Hoeflea alexandrii TaxID=288436 RepID=UPI0022AF78D1|nr:hypothetical protein [Hoeflea alexandrii]MCZ4291584.1 hypothetical protein [Hoeflea alexandrii]
MFYSTELHIAQKNATGNLETGDALGWHCRRPESQGMSPALDSTIVVAPWTKTRFTGATRVRV